MSESVLRLLAPIWRAIPQALQWRVLWLLNSKFSVGVSGVVFDAAGRVLLLQHTFRRRHPWSIVSGWLQAGESLEQALQRELAEETALAVHVERLLTVRTDRFGLAVEAVYLCRFAGGTFRPSGEVTAVDWRRPDDLPPGVHPQLVPLIRDAAAAMPAVAAGRHGEDAAAT